MLAMLPIGSMAFVCGIVLFCVGFLWEADLGWIFGGVSLYLVLHATFSYMYVFPFKFKCYSSCHKILILNVLFLSPSTCTYGDLSFSGWTFMEIWGVFCIGLSWCLIYTVKYIII